MKPRYKVTGCARFFVFAIIFIPIVFFGAAFLRGENGVLIIKDFYHKVTGTVSSSPDNSSSESRDPRSTAPCSEIEEQLLESEKENRQLKSKIRDLEKEVTDLKSGSAPSK